MRMLENMVDCHRYFYQLLLHEKEKTRVSEGLLSELDKKRGAVS